MEKSREKGEQLAAAQCKIVSLESKIVNLNKDWQEYVRKITQEMENNEKDTK